MDKTNNIPNIINAEVPVTSTDFGLFEKSTVVTSENVDKLMPSKGKVIPAAHVLGTEGFQIQLMSAFSISIAGKNDLFKQVFKEDIVPVEVPVIKGGNLETTSTFLDCPATDVFGLIPTSKSRLSEVAPEGVVLTTPIQYLSNESVSPIPPSKAYWHLEYLIMYHQPLMHHMLIVPDLRDKVLVVLYDRQRILEASLFYQERIPNKTHHTWTGAVDPLIDEDGHGTAESANIFAVAPNVDFVMVKQGMDSIGEFNAAVASNPDVISCSWTTRKPPGPLTSAEKLLSAAVANAVRQGIIVVFAAGNGHWAFPGEHPDVISAGGVFLRPDGSLQASDYASGFKSRVFPNRDCPDVCGLVGLRPRAAYILLPVPPNCNIDRECSVLPVTDTGEVWPVCQGINRHPCIDETADNDGWAVISGTSAAAPQVAGVCALMKQANPSITPVQAKEILKNSAIDVLEGHATVTNPDPQGPAISVPAGPGVRSSHWEWDCGCI